MSLFNGKFKKNLLIGGGVLAVGTTLFLTDGKELLFPEEKVVAIEKKEERTITITDLIMSESRKIDKQFSYENDHTFKFKVDDSPTMLRKGEDDSWYETAAKWTGKVFVGKEANGVLKSHFLIGYDMNNVKKEEIKYNSKTKTLYLTIPEFEVVYKPLFDEDDLISSFVGLFRLPFTPNETVGVLIEAENKGFQILEEDESIQKESLDYIEESIINHYNGVEGLENRIEKVEINFNNSYVKVENSKQ